MASKFRFKCCSNKGFTNFICIVCANIFHPSCLERDFRTHSKLGNQRIYCSTECRNDDLDRNIQLNSIVLELEKLKQENHEFSTRILIKNEEMETLEANKNDIILSLQEELTIAKEEMKARESLYKRERLRTQEFEDEVFESERKMVESLKLKRDETIKLQQEIVTLLQTKESLELEIVSRSLEITNLQRNLVELNEMNRSMISSIRVLESDNQSYCIEVSRLKKTLDDLNNTTLGTTPPGIVSCSFSGEAILSDGEEPTFPPPPFIPNNIPNVKPGRILILSDQLGYGLGSILQTQLKNSNKCFLVQSIVKPYATFVNVIEDVVNLTKDFTLSDYVIMVGGYNDLINKRFPSFKELNNLIKHLGYTNLLILSVPFKISDVYSFNNVNNAIFRFNDKLYMYLNKLDQYVEGNFLFVDSNVRGHPLKLRDLSRSIFKLLFLNRFRKNLVFPKLDGSSHSNILNLCDSDVVCPTIESGVSLAMPVSSERNSNFDVILGGDLNECNASYSPSQYIVKPVADSSVNFLSPPVPLVNP